jgi:hypothetical protein
MLHGMDVEAAFQVLHFPPNISKTSHCYFCSPQNGRFFELGTKILFSTAD